MPASKLELAVADMVHAVRNRDKVAFALPENRFHKHKRKRDELAKRRGIRRMIRPENCRELVSLLPAPDEILHCVLRGDFVLCDLIPFLLRARGKCPHLHVATLGMSVRNAETLRDLVREGTVGKLSVFVSHYFQAVDKTTTFHNVTRTLEGIAPIKVDRSHAKIMLIPTERGDHFVLEGSANLRSSDSIEQLTIFNDADLLAFHREWLEATP